LNYRELLDIASQYTPGYEVYDLAMSMITRHGLDSEEAIAGIFALLFCWNKDFYRKRTFSEMDGHIRAFRRFICEEKELILRFRSQRLEEVDFTNAVDDTTKGDIIRRLFDKLQSFLGLVGASKVLHVLLPDLIVMWDNKIITHYKVPRSVHGFLEFQKKMKTELEEAIDSYAREHQVGREEAVRRILQERYGEKLRPLTKLLDEYNWVITRPWKRSPRR